MRKIKPRAGSPTEPVERAADLAAEQPEVFGRAAFPTVNFDAFIARYQAQLLAIQQEPPSELVAVPMAGGGHQMVVQPIGFRPQRSAPKP